MHDLVLARKVSAFSKLRPRLSMVWVLRTSWLNLLMSDPQEPKHLTSPDKIQSLLRERWVFLIRF